MVDTVGSLALVPMPVGSDATQSFFTVMSDNATAVAVLLSGYVYAIYHAGVTTPLQPTATDGSVTINAIRAVSDDGTVAIGDESGTSFRGSVVWRSGPSYTVTALPTGAHDSGENAYGLSFAAGTIIGSCYNSSPPEDVGCTWDLATLTQTDLAIPSGMPHGSDTAGISVSGDKIWGYCWDDGWNEFGLYWVGGSTVLFSDLYGFNWYPNVGSRTLGAIVGTLTDYATLCVGKANGTHYTISSDYTYGAYQPLSDNGAVLCGMTAASPIVPVRFDNGVPSNLPMPGFDGNGYAFSTSGDGATICGYVTSADMSVAWPCFWRDATLYLLPLPSPDTYPFGQCFTLSRDGLTAVGQVQDESGLTRVAIWTLPAPPAPPAPAAGFFHSVF